MLRASQQRPAYAQYGRIAKIRRGADWSCQNFGRGVGVRCIQQQPGPDCSLNPTLNSLRERLIHIHVLAEGRNASRVVHEIEAVLKEMVEIGSGEGVTIAQQSL